MFNFSPFAAKNSNEAGELSGADLPSTDQPFIGEAKLARPLATAAFALLCLTAITLMAWLPISAKADTAIVAGPKKGSVFFTVNNVGYIEPCG